MHIVLGFLILLLSAFSFCLASDDAQKSIRQLTDELLSENSLKGSSWSILFSSLRDDSEIFSLDAQRLLAPASVTKLFTSAAALDALGPDYQFTTIFKTTGTMTNGVLQGDLVVQAGGDPTAETKSSKYFRASVMSVIADSLIARGLRRINGNLVLCTGSYRLEGAAMDWEIGDVNAGFAPAIDGFGFNNNVCHVGVKPGNSIGDPPHFTIEPSYAPVYIKSNVVTASSETAAWIELWFAPRDTAITLVGEIPVGDDGEYLWIPIQNPALYYGRALREALDQKGIAITGAVIVDRGWNSTNGGTVYYTHRSAPLPAVLATMNKESDNYCSEYVLSTMGLVVGGTGDRRGGIRALTRFLSKNGIKEKNVYFLDGCGLSRQNLVCAESVVALLKVMYRHPQRDVFQSTLSIAGIDGTLAYRLSSNGKTRQIIGKTGSMTHVSGVAGYATVASGETIAFAIICNNFRTTLSHVRWAQDRMIEKILSNYP